MTYFGTFWSLSASLARVKLDTSNLLHVLIMASSSRTVAPKWSVARVTRHLKFWQKSSNITKTVLDNDIVAMKDVGTKREGLSWPKRARGRECLTVCGRLPEPPSEAV